MSRHGNGVPPITIHGNLELWSETGTEGGHWSVLDDRAGHGQIERCPWNPDKPTCPGTTAYWDRMPTNIRPPKLRHTDYAGLWVLEDGHQLRVYDKERPDRLLLEWTVNLIRQPDQYAADAKHAHNWVIHTYPADLDLDTFSRWAHACYPASLTIPATTTARRQDRECAELARLTRLANPGL